MENRVFEEAAGGLCAGYVFSLCAAYISPTGSKWVSLATVGITLLVSGVAIGMALMSRESVSADYYAGFTFPLGTIIFAVRAMRDEVVFLNERGSDQQESY